LSWRELGRLLRLSLAPSAAADVAAGLVLGGRGRFPSGAGPWLLIGASLAIYTGALALNDWADRERDARERPSRPLPSGAVGERIALSIALGLFTGGIALAWAARPASGAWMTALALVAALYDLGARGPWLGPLLLGLCRAGNLAAGLAWSSAGPIPPTGLLLAAGLYGGYVVIASRLGRMEDREEAVDATRARRLLAGAALVFPAAAALAQLPLPGLPGPGIPFELPVAVAAGWGLVARARAPRAWDAGEIERAMGLLLRRLLAFDATLALAGLRFEGAGVDGLVVAAAILAGYPLAHRLRRAFPPS
jgi:4-hydroxybenzoate polyprenyltransferase